MRTNKSQLRPGVVLGSLIVSLLSATAAFAQITPLGDSYTDRADPTTNYGSKTLLEVDGATQISYIQFPLSSIPSGASVSQATLKLFVNSVRAAGSFNVYYVSSPWSESAVSSELAPALGKTIASNVSVNADDKNQYILINVTPSVEAWLSGNEPNNGFALVANGAFSASFDSKENTATGHSPQLDVVLATAGNLHWNGADLVCVQASEAPGAIKSDGITGAPSPNLGIKCVGGGGGGSSPITGVTAGLGLTGGGTSGNVTLGINTSVVPQLNAANTFTGNQTANGNLIVSGSGNGVQFADGTVQTTAATSSGIPPGLGVVGTSPTPPSGYSVLTNYQAGNNWTSPGLATLPTPAVGMATVFLNGLTYVIGGNSPTGNPLATLQAYNPVSNTWTSLAPMNTARVFPAAVTLNGLIYVIGGGSISIPPPTTGAVEVYNPTANTWTVLSSMPTPRYALGAAAVNGLIYAIGGTVFCNGNPYPANTVEIYNPTTNTWSTGTPMPNGNTINCSSPTFTFTSGLSGIAASLINGEVYVTGGNGTGNQITNGQTYMFNPNSNTWTTLATRPGNSSTTISAALLNGNMCTLDSNGELEIYNVAANTWTGGASPGGSFESLGNALYAANGSVYAVGVNPQSVAVNQQYWPATTLYIYINN
jgi:N-acetylneuraminic acid mutarotase